MNNADIKILITDLADGEIRDDNIRNILLEQINSDKSLRYDYLVQKRMKELLGGLKIHPVPVKVKQRIIGKMKPARYYSGASAYGRISPALWVYGTAAVILISLVLILFNRPPLTETSDTASTNMFTEAEANFQKILAGELKPQIISSDPAVLHKFFKEQGVTYSAVIPLFDDLKLLGAVVSDERGAKLAHHIYTGRDNKLVYVFQADESYINKGDIIRLPEAMKETLRENNCYSDSHDQISSVITVVDHNVFAVVSDLTMTEIENHFCDNL